MNLSQAQLMFFEQLFEPFTGESLFDQLTDLVFFIKNSKGEYVVVNQRGAMIHLEKDRWRFGIVDDVVGNPDALIPKVDPDAKGRLLLVIDAPDEIALNDRIDSVVELDPRCFPSPEFPPVVGLLDEITCDERARCPFLAGDACLSAATNDVVSDDMVPKGLYITIIDARGMPQDNPNAAGIGDGTVLYKPVFTHASADGTHL